MSKAAIGISAALILFLAAGFMMWKSLNYKAPQQSSLSQAQVNVAVAASDIAPGQVIGAQDVAMQRLASSRVADGALTRADDVENHMAVNAIHKGAQVVRAAVSAQPVLGLAAHIPSGYRAYALPVTEAAIAGGFLQVGDHVDLYVTLPGGLFAQPQTGHSPDDQSRSTPLIESVAVLAVGTKLQTAGAAETAARTVTLALRPADLSRVALAARLGAVTFAVRNPVDRDAPPPQSATLASLVPPAAQPVAAMPVRAARVAHGDAPGGIEVYTGTARGVVRVP